MDPGGIGRRLEVVSLAAVCCAAVAIPASAGAASLDTYVDDSAPDNNLPCTQADPCQQINTALGDTLPNGTVHVAAGSYSTTAPNVNVNMNVADGRSVLGAGPQNTIIDSSNFGNTFIVQNTGAGTISGFDFKGQNAFSLSGNATITGNRFSREAGNSTAISVPAGVTAATTISGNEFVDPNAADRQTGISLAGGTTPVIRNNTFAGLSNPIDILGASPQITENEMTGIHTSPGFNGIGIQVRGGAPGSGPTITANFIHLAPLDPINTTGIDITKLAGHGVVGAAMERNRILGYATGVIVSNSDGPVTLNGDLLANSNNDLDIGDSTGVVGQGDVTATNITSVSALRVFGVGGTDPDLTLDSSIAQFVFTLGSTDHGCLITNSRGDVSAPPPANNGCDDFQTTADPQFVDDDPFGDFENNDHRLAAGSPLIDAGAPGPAAGLALGGNPRAIAATCGGTPRRDMGAYEFEPSCGNPSGGAQAPPVVPPVPAKKKCKKGFKLKKGKCKRKKKRKRK